jgi:uncharacterized protein
MKKLLHLLLFLIAVGAYQQTKAQQKTTDGVFYSITKPGIKDTSWLFGTYHLINESYLQTTPQVIRAFNKSANVVVEVVIDSSELTTANSKALLQNKKLSALLQKPFADSLDNELKTNVGAGLAQMDVYKPMMVMLTLSMVNLMKDNQEVLSKYTGQPLDVSFVTNGKKQQKLISPLENITQQMDFLFNTLDDEKQAVMLQDFLRNKEAGIKVGNDLLKSYFENDIHKIEALYQASLNTGADMDFLVKARNKNWMKRLPTLIQKQSNFIAVGAMHLCGEDGLINQLRKLGYTVTAQPL